MIIWNGGPPANDHPDELASCKWSSGWTDLLQMIIRMDWPLASYHPYGPPLANDYPEGLASCKWSYGGCSHLQMITRKIRPLANDHLEGQAICKWPPKGSALLKLIIQRIWPTPERYTSLIGSRLVFSIRDWSETLASELTFLGFFFRDNLFYRFFCWFFLEIFFTNCS